MNNPEREYGQPFLRDLAAMQKLMNNTINAALDIMTIPITPKIEPMVFICHPSRYEMLRKHLLENGARPATFNPSEWLCGVRIIQSNFVATTIIVRRRRWIPKRKRWHMRKYRLVEVPLLGYWMQAGKTVMVTL